ncbi:F0F1 ATP synthase subunit delta [Saxibacter everestensis]|uniref:ATP synthase subunit delta n=1 Tax=Saxibacter everestensis TaxID=2909229 RepID=A0ABY8QNK8_9MICO|nr:F0F1 ATP synthase subunit delta [Brevibacteriaceae bacterium ZFBP1038]
MRGASRQSFAQAVERLEPLIAADGALPLGQQLLQVVGVLGSSSPLRKALTEPSRSVGDKQQLLKSILGSHVSDTTLDVVGGLIESQWSRSGDLVDAAERLGVISLAGSAQNERRMDEVEDQLFRFSRILAGNHDLQRALNNPDAPNQAKARLVEDLLGDRVAVEAVAMIGQAAVHPRGKTTAAVLESYGEILASRRAREIATVTVAKPLAPEQVERLGAALSRTYGRELVLNIQINPEIVGGLKVQVGDEVVDGSVATRLDDVRRRLAS